MLREVLRALLGARFSRISAGLQAVFIVALVTSFLLLPAILNRAGRPEQREARMLPPVWFVGLHEALAGGLVTGLPRGALPDDIARQEDRAAARYREIAVSIRPLAWRAVAALTASLAIAIAAFFWNSRQLPLPLVGNRAGRYRGPGLFTRVVTLTLVRRPATQAGFFFTLQCVFRSGPHRVVMAGCTAVSIALATVFLAAGSRSPAGDLSSVPGYVFSTQTIALAVLLAGFRHVMRLPADISREPPVPAGLGRRQQPLPRRRAPRRLRRHRPAGDRPAAAAASLPARHAARVDARAVRVPPGCRAHLPDDVQDEPAAVRRQLRSGTPT